MVHMEMKKGIAIGNNRGLHQMTGSTGPRKSSAIEVTKESKSPPIQYQACFVAVVTSEAGFPNYTCKNDNGTFQPTIRNGGHRGDDFP